MASYLPSILVLGAAAAAAFFLTVNRDSSPDLAVERRSAARALAIAAAVQGVHFLEEALTGLDQSLGTLIGSEGIPRPVFLAFNLLWLGVWVASVPGIRSARPFAFFAAWFLAIAGVFNGILHPLLALASGGYFPGLWSSPLIGIVSVWLWFKLQKATSPAAVNP